MVSVQTSEPSQDIADALRIAREMIDAGIPVFAAPPCPEAATGNGCGHGGCISGYHLPAKWQLTVPATVWLDRWRPGWALGAVGGHLADFLDEDPRNGGSASVEELRTSGHMPRVFGVQATPSGGFHYVISPLHERESNAFMPGLDYQGGRPDGKGRAFVWIAPTVKRSKVEPYEKVPYVWLQPPDLGYLRDFGDDDSGMGLRDRILARKERKERDQSRQSLTTREFTEDEARQFCSITTDRLMGAPIGDIENLANAAACQLSHFVPEFWSEDFAYAVLTNSLGETAYDPNHPASSWTAEKFHDVLAGVNGRAPGDWEAVRKPELIASVVPPEVTQDRADWLEGQLVSADELAELPAPVPLIYDLLDKNSESWIIGAPGSFKSFIALDLAAHVGMGKEWHGHRVRQERVLYLAAEGANGMTLRTRAWREVYGRMEGVDFLPLPVQVSNVADWQALVKVAERREYGFVVIDTQHRVTKGLDENTAEGMGHYTSAVTAIREATGACVLTVHHTGRNGQDARGSSAIDGAQDTELKLTRMSPRSSMKVKIKEDKQKDQSENEEGIELTLRVIELGIDSDTDRVLNSLVVSSDVYVNAATLGPDAPEEWELGQGPVIVKLFKVLRDQGGKTGLTKAEARAAIVERFYGNNTKALAKSTWYTAWDRGQEKQAVSGDPVMINVSGEKWIVDPEALAGMESGAFLGNGTADAALGLGQK